MARYIGSLEAVQLVANVEREQKTWFTEKTNYPKTALPSISGVPESNLGVHLSLKSVHVDLDKVGNYVEVFSVSDLNLQTATSRNGGIQMNEHQ